jgi:transcriptional regulator with XRE-family HTH domain
VAVKLRNRLLYLVTEKERREQRRISQTELAGELGMAYTTVGRWLENKIERYDSPLVEKVAEYFKLTQPNDLFYFETIQADADSQP